MVNGRKGWSFSRMLGNLCAAAARKSGYRVYPNTCQDFYWAIPDRSTLRDEIWTRASEMPGVRMNVPEQLQRLESFRSAFGEEYDQLNAEPVPQRNRFTLNNTSFNTPDAQILYCMIRHYKPRRMIEIGAGYSTLLTAETLLRNQREHGIVADFTTIDPYPAANVAGGVPGLTRLLPNPVQEVPLEEFGKLEANDILVIDSSHVLCIGSDVHYEFLEVLPRLQKGVIVHVHDISLPTEYPREFTMRGLFWDEQYLLQMFLAFNDSFEVLLAGNFLHVNHRAALAKAINGSGLDGVRPSSFWMRRVK